ncbi:MAG: glycoside hydrolase family 65 protein [Candidatus Dormibacteraceae bacterium]
MRGLGDDLELDTGRGVLAFRGFAPETERLREALTSTGNGQFCTRGALEWTDADGTHYPATYRHGVMNRETTIMAGEAVRNEDLVNLPNWLLLQLRIEQEEPLRLDAVELLDYRHEYSVADAVLVRHLRFRDQAGRTTSLTSRRFVNMAGPHQAGLEWTLVPEDWSGRVQIISALDGRVVNRGVARYRELEGRHLDPVQTRLQAPDVISLRTQTRQSHIYIAEAARTRVFAADEEVTPTRSFYEMEDYIHQVLQFDVRQGAPTRVEKMVALYTSRDRAISEAQHNAEDAVTRYEAFATALERHHRAWDELWATCEVRLPSDPEAELLLRFHIAHVLQVCSPLTADLDAGVPARGLNGEAYRGHVFWDELYIYPFLNHRLPQITRGLLLYRYRRLGQARALAHDAGYGGAMFPWQSGSDGREETQTVHLNPMSGRWDPDLSHRQRHVNAAIFFNVWRYFQATGDIEFLLGFGAEMLLEIARFWGTLAHFNPDRGRYEIHGVMGPDEFHERYPDEEEGGLRNNAYTNVMVAWLMDIAGQVLRLLPEARRQALRAGLQLGDQEVARWEDISRRMLVPFHDGVLSQFEGYESLTELDWDAYSARHPNLQRLDRILRAEDDTPDRYQVAKQADTLMLFFLFSEAELRTIFERLGYPYEDNTLRRNVDYYAPRTTHGSTLSYVVHAHLLAQIDPQASWGLYLQALASDAGDVQGGTTQEGIHMGVMAGTLDLLQRAYLGADVRGDVLHFAPQLLDRLQGLVLPMRFRGVQLRVEIEGPELRVTAGTEGGARSIQVAAGGETRKVRPGDRYVFRLDAALTES